MFLQLMTPCEMERLFKSQLHYSRNHTYSFNGKQSVNYKKISLTILSLSRNGNFSRIWFTTFEPLVSSVLCLLEENDNFCKFFSAARLMSFFWAFCNSFKSSLCRLSAPWEVSRTELFTSSCSRNALRNSC